MLACAIITAAAVGYLLGNGNGALIVSRLVFHEDVRTKGSGNAGLTNFFRNYGGLSTLLVIAIDVGKTVLACFAGGLLFRAFGLKGDSLWTLGKMVGGFACVVGHSLPVFFGFHGGKGVLCSGVLSLCMCPWTFLILFAVFVILFSLTHYVSLGSVACGICYPIVFAFFFPKSLPILLMACGVTMLVVLLHLPNLRRLFAGSESKVYLKKR
ncbi:MAG: glycerol-3-phosphate acyltransferase [Clostridia bacterium]|nr:glycerol-3-phosphate acyltransferase [Clostridia bacterium]